MYVRGGAILPIAPLVQNTNEIPKGPLTLRVYAGSNCRGHLYLDDGKSYDYMKGESLRVDFHCAMTADGLRINIGKHVGPYPAWWRQIRVEVFGWASTKQTVLLDGAIVDASNVTDHPLSVTIPDNGSGVSLDLR